MALTPVHYPFFALTSPRPSFSLGRSLLQALSARYKDRMALGITNPKNKAVAAFINATRLPAVAVLPKAEGLEPTPFTDKVSFIALDFFLMDHALPKRGAKKAPAGDAKEQDEASSPPPKNAESGKTAEQGKAKPKATPSPASSKSSGSSNKKSKSTKSGSKQRATDLSKLTRPALNAVRLRNPLHLGT